MFVNMFKNMFINMFPNLLKRKKINIKRFQKLQGHRLGLKHRIFKA